MTEQNTFAISELQQQANNGYAQAQFDLALCYVNGRDIEKNTELAFDWYKKAAEQGNVNAQFALGLYYFLGNSRGQHTKQIVERWYRGADTGKNVDPALDLAVSQALPIKSSGANDDLAFAWLKKAAEQNHAEAIYWLGQCYRNGIGTEQNDELAFDCFRIAAEQDCPEAYLLLGDLYVEGKGVEQNDELAFKWYEKAAEKNVAEAQYHLANCYEQGIGVEQNEDLAFKHYELAALGGHELAKNRLGKHYFSAGAMIIFFGEKKEKDHELAFEFFTKSIEYGHLKTFEDLAEGYCACDFNESYSMAVNWYEKLAKQGHVEAGNWLAKICRKYSALYYAGDGVEKDDQLALKLILKATEYGDAQAYFYASIMRLNQAKDNEEIGKFVFEGFKIAAEQIQDSDIKLDANTFLGHCYNEGIGTEQNLELAKQYNQQGSDVSKWASGLLLCPPKSQLAKEMLDISLGIHFKDKYFDSAKDLINQAFNDAKGIEKGFKKVSFLAIEQAEQLSIKNQELKEKNKQLQDANHRMQRLVEQFTHSLGNVIFPDTIYQVAERLKNNPECRKDVLLLHEAYHSEIIIKLQGELLRQRYANTNAESFRQLIRRCRRTPNAAESTKSIEDILDYAASRVTARFLNQHYAGLNSIRDNILSKKNVSLDALKQKFEDDILLNKSLRPIAWVNQNLRPIQITEISPLWKKVFIFSESHAEALLFGYFSEILFNAFKYADHDKDEFLTLVFDEKNIDDKTYLTCSWQNPVKNKSPSMLGTGKGLDAIQEDLKQLNDTENPEESLLISQQKNQFQVTLFFKKDLLVNDLPSLKIKRKANVE